MKDARSEPDDVAWPAVARVPVEITVTGRGWRHEYVTHQLQALVPPKLARLEIALPAPLTARVVEAERALAALDADMRSADIEAVEAATFALLRSESVSSSRIEGVAVSNRRLAEAIHDLPSARRLALEVVGNVDAMRAAVEFGTAAMPLQPAHILDMHRRLMAPVPGAAGGEWRSVQNWIGAANPDDGVAYVPPPPVQVPDLIHDLCTFVNSSSTSAVVRAAIAHAQFEAIHPFTDGNGRVGRCLISVVLRSAGGTTTIPPVSSVLLADTNAYFHQLQRFQQHADPAPWIDGFAAATVEACARARALVDDMGQLQLSWRKRLGTVRRGSHLERLLHVLPTLTIASAEQVAERLTIDANVARRLLTQLELAGIVTQTAAGRRNRVWRVDEMFRLLDAHSLSRTDTTADLEAAD